MWGIILESIVGLLSWILGVQTLAHGATHVGPVYDSPTPRPFGQN